MNTRLRDIAIGAALVTLGMLLAPVASQAAGTLMTIVDDDTTTKSQVDTGGKLRVGDGSGPLTVDGTVRTTKADQPVKLLSVAPSVAHNIYTAVSALNATGYTRFQLYAWTSCAASQGCAAATLRRNSGPSNALVLGQPMNFAALSGPGLKSPVQTVLFDVMADTIQFQVLRPTGPAANPVMNLVLYGLK